MEPLYPCLETCLSVNQALKKVIFDTYQDNAEYLTYLNDLFRELLNGSVQGVDVKIKETKPKIVDSEEDPLFHFRSLISELEFARFFVKSNMSVELLPSDAFNGRKSPDMLIKNSHQNYFVEVKNMRIDSEAWNFGLKIAEILNKKGLKYMVTISSSNKLSMPSYMHASISQKEKSKRQALIQFEENLDNIPDNLQEIKLTTEIADVELRHTTKNKSFLGISTMQEAISQPDEYNARIRYDITNKCGKRVQWVNDELTIPYIIAIDDESWLFTIDTYNGILYGDAESKALLVNGKFINCLPECGEGFIDEEISMAIKRGWNGYLISMCILPNGYSLIPKEKRGLFFNEAMTKNSSAILVRKHNNTYYLLANPFADEKINCLRVLQDFRNCKTGWE